MDVLITITDEDIAILERALTVAADLGTLRTAQTLSELLDRVYRARSADDALPRARHLAAYCFDCGHHYPCCSAPV